MIGLVVHLLALIGCLNSSDILATCQGGDVKACYNDGIAKINAPRPLYSGARKDFVQACMPTYTKGSRPKDNFPAGCYELGKLVRDAKGGPTDLPRAVEMFQIACRAGIEAACIDLGMLVYDPASDSGVRSDPARAVEFFFNACNTVGVRELAHPDETDPNARACWALGRAYVDGQGVENNRRDPKRALQMFRKGCDAKYAPACESAGNLLASARSTVSEASELYQRACKLDPRHGCFEVAEMHEKSRLPDSSMQLAVDFYRKTCNIDPTRGCYEAAVLLEQRKVVPREGEVESLYNLACEYGHQQACTKRSPGR